MLVILYFFTILYQVVHLRKVSYLTNPDNRAKIERYIDLSNPKDDEEDADRDSMTVMQKKELKKK